MSPKENNPIGFDLPKKKTDNDSGSGIVVASEDPRKLLEQFGQAFEERKAGGSNSKRDDVDMDMLSEIVDNEEEINLAIDIIEELEYLIGDNDNKEKSNFGFVQTPTKGKK